MSRYPSNGTWGVCPFPLTVGQRVRLDTDRFWWTVRAVTENFTAVVRQAEFQPRGTLLYAVLDWRNGVRGPCNLVGQAWGSGDYTEDECAQMLVQFEAGDLEVSQRNWVRIVVAMAEDRP